MSKKIHESYGIQVVFRFHGNFYHSYRGDTPDEKGFGKDIRIIRHLIDTLDRFNADGVPVKGTWDFENYFSLETTMPRHCPELIEGMQRRVRENGDEAQVMSYNNGMINAHTAQEFDAAIAQAITNQKQSGLADMFGNFGPMVRPQEMMFTPKHLDMYPAHGITSISLFYSSLPFNGFSNFVPELSVKERYNPLTLTYPGIEGSMVLVPAYNVGDVLDNISLRHWVKRLRRKQLKMDDPSDLLILIDMDADDEFWYGFDVPVISKMYSTGRGLAGLIESVKDLDYVSFTTPSEYLKDHKPVNEISFGQDTADGSFDGMASWAEKWSNQELWTGIERSRILELQTRRLLEMNGISNDPEIEGHLSRAFELRVRALSTTHFGMAAPVMNVTRLNTAKRLVAESVASAGKAFELAVKAGGEAGTEKGFTLVDYTRGITTDTVTYNARPSRALVRIPLKGSDEENTIYGLTDGKGNPVPHVLQRNGEGSIENLMVIASMEAKGKNDFILVHEEGEGEPPIPAVSVEISRDSVRNDFLVLRLDKKGNPVELKCNGNVMQADPLVSSCITYRGKRREVKQWEIIDMRRCSGGTAGLIQMKGSIPIGKGQTVNVQREFMMAANLPYLYVNVTVQYPQTHFKKFNRGRAERLEQQWDARWHEVMPCQLNPGITGVKGAPVRVWKHNYVNHVSTYDLNYGEFSKNRELDSCNNHITSGWVALTDGKLGLLCAQTSDVLSSLAFCPLRTRIKRGKTSVYMNPFGSYTGSQYKYASAYTGLGRGVAIHLSASDHISPYAPSYNGKTQTFSLMLAPYAGDCPPEEVQADAAAFSYPYMLLSGSELIGEPPHRNWEEF
jgi:hypothetical protein